MLPLAATAVALAIGHAVGWIAPIAAPVAPPLPPPVARSLAAEDEHDPSEPWWDATLGNGLRVALVDAPLSESQATFTLLPVGLLSDDAGRCQFAHLVEHLMVRSTDPSGLADGELLVNGETMAGSLRVETMAPLERWEEGLARHARWLTVSDVDAVVLAREQRNIAGEEESTVAGGYTHKWAAAAWNQVVRHGAAHAAVHGDVAGADAEAARAYLGQRARVRPGALVVSVGPQDRQEVLAALEAELGDLPITDAVLPAATRDRDAIRTAADHAATWDLPARHYMEWYLLPDDGPADRVAADTLAQLVNVRLQQRASLRMDGINAYASTELATPEGRWLVVSAALPEELEIKDLRKSFDELLRGIDTAAETAYVIQNLTTQLGGWPDFAALRAQAAGRPGVEWIEAQQALYLAYAQLSTGLSRLELANAYGALDVETVGQLARDVLVPENRGTLLLEPSEG